MPDEKSITILHLSDLQFGKNHRFGLDIGSPDAKHSTLLGRLTQDLDSLKKDHGLRPDLAVFTGDLTEWGKKTEFEDLRGFVEGLSKHLELSHDRMIMIPGNHDVNHVLCKNYFELCGEEGVPPAPYYFEKWKYFKVFFDQFYRDIPKIQFTQEQPYTLFEIPEVNCVVAGLNSAMKESHDNHYGFVGEEQLRWFKGQLEAYKQKGWFRIAAVHHNYQRVAVDDDEKLRDADDLKRLLEDSVNMLLHGHVHQAQIGWLTQKAPILAAGSAAVKKEYRPDETLNQYQLIQVHANRFVRYCRSYVPSRKTWAWDNAVHTDPVKPFEEEKVPFDAVSAALPNDGRKVIKSFDLHWNIGRQDDTFLSRVEKICKLRHSEAEITRYNEQGKVPYLSVCRKEGTITHVYPLGVVERSVNDEIIETFAHEIVSKYRSNDPGVIAYLVYGDAMVPDDELCKRATQKRIHLQSFIAYQGLIDFSGYVQRQTKRLENDVIYPPKLYVPQRLCVKEVNIEVEGEAVGMTLQWLREPAGRFILILGEFGTGKTFLLRQLALRLAQDGHSYPLLLEMRSLEKTNHLDNLVAQQIARENIEYKSDKFRYMLAEGRVVLLFDGFDELANRVTYERATEHLDVLIDAAQGERARVVVTSRTQHFISDRQVKLKMMEKVEMVNRHRIAYLQKFQPAQIKQFLCNYLGSEEEAEKRYNLIDDIKDLLGLSENPRMLSFIAELPEADLLVARREQGEITAAKLYELLLNRWLKGEQDRVSLGHKDELQLSDRWQAVTALAMSLWVTTELRIGIDGLKEEMRRELKTLLDIGIAAQQIASGTLLVRDEEGRFGFIHQSVIEWLVARHAAEKGRLNEVLSCRPISLLMADFLCELSDRTPLAVWTRDALAQPGGGATKNALLLEQRLQKRGVTIHGVKNLVGEMLRGQDFSGQDLSNADFSNADVTEANFRGCNLRGARFQGAVLYRANLVKAGLQRANVSGADCREANLTGADLTGAEASGTDFYRAKLFAAQMEVDVLDKGKAYGAALPGEPCQAAHSFIFTTRCVAINPQGDLLVIGGDYGYLGLWDIKTCLELKVLAGHESTVYSVAFDPSGRLLASGSRDNTVRLWNVEGKSEVKVLRGHKSHVSSVAFDPSGRLLASGSGDKTLRLWDVEGKNETSVLRGHESSIHSVAFDPSGRLLASGSGDKTVRLWDVEGKNEMKVLRGHESHVSSVAFDPSGRLLASGSGDKTLRLWDVEGKNEVQVLRGHKDLISSVAFDPSGRLLASGSGDKTVRLWDIEGKKESRVLSGHESKVYSVAFDPSGRFLASGSWDTTVRLWDIEGKKETQVLCGHKNGVSSVAFNPSGNLLASGSRDKTVKLWDIEGKKETKVLCSHESHIFSVAFDPNDKLLARGSYDTTVRLWDVEKEKEMKVLCGHVLWVSSVAFDPSGRLLASGSGDTTVRLWNVEGKKRTQVLRGHKSRVSSVAFDPSSRLLASGSWDTTVRLWDVKGEKEAKVMRGHKSHVCSVAFDPSGRLLASGSGDKTVRLWDIEGKKETQVLCGHKNWVNSVAFDPSGRLLASSSEDNTVRLWEVATGRCMAILLHLPEGWVIYTPEGRYKMGGNVGNNFWHVISLCRFAPGELDEFIPNLRIPMDESILA